VRIACVGRLVVMSALLVGAGAGQAALASASSGSSGLAGRLADRDPGARIDGNTIVATGDGQRILTVPDRPNFVISLGSGETIVGGASDDQLGALGVHDTIVAGKGHDLIVGGPAGTLVGDGTGHDLLIDSKPGATIELKSPKDEVVVSGNDDRVLCSGDSVDDVIHAGRRDSVAKTCRRDHDQVLAFRQAKSAAHAATSSVTGDGSNLNPYTSGPCASAYIESCVVEFPSRTLSGYWANEYVPAYRCPPDHPYLRNTSYSSGSNKVPLGVAVGVDPQGAVGVSISGTSHQSSTSASYATGTATGFPNSSATNWSFDTSSYTVVLYCTASVGLASTQ
jgi:hypothetical protein